MKNAADRETIIQAVSIGLDGDHYYRVSRSAVSNIWGRITGAVM